MKAQFTLGDVIVSLPIQYLNQQTCRDSVFELIPVDMVDMSALVLANKANRSISWYVYTRDEEKFYKIYIPTDLIEWVEE